MEVNNELEKIVGNLSYEGKQELDHFVNYLKFKEKLEHDRSMVGNISFEEFKKLVFEKIDEDYIQEKIIYEHYSSDTIGFYADILYISEPFDSKEKYSIIHCNCMYNKENKKLKMSYSQLWRDMLDAITKFESSEKDFSNTKLFATYD